MITRGLTDEEIAQLTAAGFIPALARAVAREALTMRWLFLRRGLSGFWAVTAGILVVVAAYIASWRLGGFGWLIGLAVSLLPVVQFAPHLEAWSLKRIDPLRFAGRTLAIMAVAAQRNPNPESNAQLGKLRILAESLDTLSHPHTQLRLLARSMDNDAAGARTDGGAAGAGDGFGASLLFGLFILAVTVIFITLALGARPF